MDNPFFDHPILNSPYEYPRRYWELDDQGQPTQQIIERRRRAEFITPIPKPKKRKGLTDQQQIIFDEGKGLSTQKQQYDSTAIINRVRQEVDQWRSLPTYGRWAFAEFTEVYQIQADFKAKVESEFNKMIAKITQS
jgi:type III restriction enzyme